MFDGFTSTFPSPIGELHFSIIVHKFTENLGEVSVPYRGATFLNTINNALEQERGGIVSVPYRGATFIKIWQAVTTVLVLFVSVPYRGATFLKPSPQTRLQSGVNTGIAWQK